MIDRSHHSSVNARASLLARSKDRHRWLPVLLLPGLILMASPQPVMASSMCKGEADKLCTPEKGMAPAAAQPQVGQIAMALLAKGGSRETVETLNSSLDLTATVPKDNFSRYFKKP